MTVSYVFFWLQMEANLYMFNSEALRKLLTNKFVVFIGDSGKQ